MNNIENYNYIPIEDIGITLDSLVEDYSKSGENMNALSRKYGVSAHKIKNWLTEAGVKIRTQVGKFDFDKTFFDEIDTEEKAYWLGFVWCDGSVVSSKGSNSLAVKLSLGEVDINHVYKFKSALKSEHNVKVYKISAGFDSNTNEARLLIGDTYFGKNLREKYGMIPHRSDSTLLIDSIPTHLMRHFLRGVYDADGSLTLYHVQEKNCKNPTMKMSLQIYTNETLIDFIQEHFVKIGLRERKTKTVKRHKDRDGSATALNISGTNQAVRILEYLYEDSTIYLDRKYEKFLEMKEAKRVLRATSTARNQYSA